MGRAILNCLPKNSTGSIDIKGTINNTVLGNTEIINNNTGASGITVSGI